MSGTISVEEVQVHMDEPAVLAYLEALELSIQDVEMFFKMMAKFAGAEFNIHTSSVFST